MAKDRIDRNELADKLIETASSTEDPLRAMAEMIADFVMEAEVTAKVGAEPHERSPERTTQRNGFRTRRWCNGSRSFPLKFPRYYPGGFSRS
ncbi:MAG: transposase [Acidobacteria bacterium]|nr:transposase [Acidobacteriota bacterium]